MTEIIKRLLHTRGRKKQAMRNFYVRTVQDLFGISSMPTTEINYLLEGRFETQILSRSTISTAGEWLFETQDGKFRHNFNTNEVITLSCAVVDTEFNYIYAISNQGTLHLLEESTDWNTSKAVQYYKPSNLDPSVALSGVGLGLGSRGFYHMISEDLSRIMPKSEMNKVIQYSNSSRASFEILETMPLEIVRVPKFVKIENLTFVTHGNDLGYINTWQLRALKENFKHSIGPNAKEKIFVSRSLTRRSPSFELELMNKMQEIGFKVVHLENHTLDYQIRLFSSAQVIVGVHGAGLTGSLWSHQPLVIELMDENYFNRCFEWQTLMNLGKYARILYSSKTTSAEYVFEKILNKLNEE